MSALGEYAGLSLPRSAIIGNRIVVLDAIDSTNSFALATGGDGTVVVSDTQTAGRGRLGRTWLSLSGQGLWFSVRLEGLIKGLVFAAALAVRDAIDRAPNVAIKWPNDILVNKKKVCGILAEHRDGISVLGIGINVHQQPDAFPRDLRSKASSLQHEFGGTWSRAHLLESVLTHLERSVMLLRSGAYDSIRDSWADACDLQGQAVRVDGISGRVIEIDASGALQIETPSGVRTVVSGDMTRVEKE